MTSVHLQQISKHFGSTIALDGIDLHIQNGELFFLLGPSGCGKTTTVRLLTGLYEPSVGEAWVLGRHPKAFNQHIRRKIGYMPQLFALYQDLSIWENINFAASLYGVSLRRSRQLKQVLDFVELSEHKHKLARNISGGMQRRLSLAAAQSPISLAQ